MIETHHIFNGTNYWLSNGQWWVEYQVEHGAIYPQEYQQAWPNTSDLSKLEWTRGTNGGGKAIIPDAMYRIKCDSPVSGHALSATESISKAVNSTNDDDRAKHLCDAGKSFGEILKESAQ